jgi:hypothetical protein
MSGRFGKACNTGDQPTLQLRMNAASALATFAQVLFVGTLPVRVSYRESAVYAGPLKLFGNDRSRDLSRIAATSLLYMQSICCVGNMVKGQWRLCPASCLFMCREVNGHEHRFPATASGHQMPVRAKRRACWQVAFRLPANRSP